jgi:hypothetical protein
LLGELQAKLEVGVLVASEADEEKLQSLMVSSGPDLKTPEHVSHPSGNLLLDGWGAQGVSRLGVFLELHAEGGEKCFDFGPRGLEVVRGLKIESDIEGVGGGACEFGDRLFDCDDQSSECSDDLRRSFERLVGAGEPLQGVLGSDFDSLFDIYQYVCHRDVSLFLVGGQAGLRRARRHDFAARSLTDVAVVAAVTQGKSPGADERGRAAK